MQLLLSALGTALLCALVAVFLLGERASDSNIRMLDEQVRLGEQALVRQWALHRAERQRAFAAVASQPALREALSAGNRSVLSAFVQQARTAGADAVALVNRQGQAMSQDGPSGLLLPELTQRSHVPESGALFALTSDLFDVFRLPVGTALFATASGTERPWGMLTVPMSVLVRSAAPGERAEIQLDTAQVGNHPCRFDGVPGRVFCGDPRNLPPLSLTSCEGSRCTPVAFVMRP